MASNCQIDNDAVFAIRWCILVANNWDINKINHWWDMKRNPTFYKYLMHIFLQIYSGIMNQIFIVTHLNLPPTIRSKTIHKYMQISFSYLTSLETSLSRIFIIPPFCWRKKKILWTKATSLNFNVFSRKYPFCLIMLFMCT